MPIYRRGEIWHIKITHQGRVVRRSTHTSDRTQAQRQHDEIKADLWESGQGLDPLLSEVLMHWLTVRLRTVNERNCCSAFLNLYPDRRVSQITAEGIRTALASKSNGTTNRYLSVVCASLRLAERSGLCLLKPNTIPQKRSSPPGRTTFLSQIP